MRYPLNGLLIVVPRTSFPARLTERFRAPLRIGGAVLFIMEQSVWSVINREDDLVISRKDDFCQQTEQGIRAL